MKKRPRDLQSTPALKPYLKTSLGRAVPLPEYGGGTPGGLGGSLPLLDTHQKIFGTGVPDGEKTTARFAVDPREPSEPSAVKEQYLPSKSHLDPLRREVIYSYCRRL